MASPLDWREQRQGFIRLAGGRQRQPQVDANPLVVGCKLCSRSERPFGIGPSPLEVIAVARVVPDLRVFRTELEGLLVMDFGLGKPSQPIEGACHPSMGQGFVRRLKRPAPPAREDRQSVLILEHGSDRSFLVTRRSVRSRYAPEIAAGRWPSHGNRSSNRAVDPGRPLRRRPHSPAPAAAMAPARTPLAAESPRTRPPSPRSPPGMIRSRSTARCSRSHARPRCLTIYRSSRHINELQCQPTRPAAARTPEPTAGRGSRYWNNCSRPRLPGRPGTATG